MTVIGTVCIWFLDARGVSWCTSRPTKGSDGVYTVFFLCKGKSRQKGTLFGGSVFHLLSGRLFIPYVSDFSILFLRGV